MRTKLIMSALLFAGPAVAGPISKFDARPPEIEISSSRSLEQVERCLIDLDGFVAPSVFQQPDRPDHVTLVYPGPNNISAGRIDLDRIGGSVTIKAWLKSGQVRGCAG